MEFKGTKGKWFVNARQGRGSSYLSIESGNGRICNINSKRIEMYNEEISNATLIAHAPEMLDMLKEVLASEHLKGTIIESKIKRLLIKATEI